MSGRIYSSTFDGVAVVAAQDLFEVLSAATACLEILSVHLSQETEVADVAEEMLTIMFQGHSGAFTGGSVGSTPAVVPTHLGDAAAVAIVEAGVTTIDIDGDSRDGSARISAAMSSWLLRV